MPIQFNPPPGWPDPDPAWLPTQDWLPDPSWPEPPGDWQFWTVTPEPAAPLVYAAEPGEQPAPPAAPAGYGSSRLAVLPPVDAAGAWSGRPGRKAAVGLGAGATLLVALALGSAGESPAPVTPLPAGATSTPVLTDSPSSSETTPAPSMTNETTTLPSTPAHLAAVPTTTSPPAVTVQPKPTTAQPKPSKTTYVQGVRPGSFCSVHYAYGYTAKGTLMQCQPSASDSRFRWRKA